MARGTPSALLRAYVREYVGWWEYPSAPIIRREVPTDIVPLIVNFGERIRVYEAGSDSKFNEYGTFTTGVYDTFVLVRTSGPSGGLQINLTIPGARRLLARPLGELTNQ